MNADVLFCLTSLISTCYFLTGKNDKLKRSTGCEVITVLMLC